MKRLKLRKKTLLPLLIIIAVIVLLIFFLVRLKDKSYSLEYDIGNYKISENYNQNDSIYYYEIKAEDIFLSRGILFSSIAPVSIKCIILIRRMALCGNLRPSTMPTDCMPKEDCVELVPIMVASR